MLVEWLREEMRARGLLQKEMGALAGWDEYTTSKVMRGVRDISAAEFVALMSPEARQALAEYLDRVSRA